MRVSITNASHLYICVNGLVHARKSFYERITRREGQVSITKLQQTDTSFEHVLQASSSWRVARRGLR